MSETAPHHRPDHRIPADAMLRVSSVPGRALIRILALAHRRRMDVSTVVQSLSREFPGDSGERMMSFASVLATGAPVVDALEQTPGLLDRTSVTALRLAEQDEMLPEMYDAMLAENELDDPSAVDSWNSAAGECAQVALGFAIAWFMLMFLAIFVVPTFEAMFNNFGIALPSLFVLLISFVSYLPALFALGALFVLLYLAFRASAILSSLRSKRNPLADGGRLNTSSANVRRLLAVAVQTGRPVASRLPTLASHCELATPRRRLKQASQRIEQGEEPWGSLASERVLTRREANALALAESGGTQAWLLRWSASVLQHRRVVRGRFFASAVSILSTLLLGLIVAWAAIAVFMVLSELITGLA